MKVEKYIKLVNYIRQELGDLLWNILHDEGYIITCDDSQVCEDCPRTYIDDTGCLNAGECHCDPTSTGCDNEDVVCRVFNSSFYEDKIKEAVEASMKILEEAF